MAKRSTTAKSEPLDEMDRVEGHEHPRQAQYIVGQNEVLARASRAIRAGHVPPGWLITGPPGVGKATLAYRIARYLLTYGATGAGAEDLSVPQSESASIQIAAGAHSGLLVLRRSANPQTGRMMTVLGVEEVRRLAGFFGMTSGAGGWRVAIVDSADEMNDNAANALLKALEEPPSRAVLILLANAPGRLLPTIRSRCQRLDLRPLSDADMDNELAVRLPDWSADARASLIKLAGGSIGLALRMASSDGLAMAKQAEQLIDNAENTDSAEILMLADKLSRGAGGVDMFGEYLTQSLELRILARARNGTTGLRQWVNLLEKMRRNFLRTRALHLEPRQTILSSANAIADAAKHGRL